MTEPITVDRDARDEDLILGTVDSKLVVLDKISGRIYPLSGVEASDARLREQIKCFKI